MRGSGAFAMRVQEHRHGIGEERSSSAAWPAAPEKPPKGMAKPRTVAELDPELARRTGRFDPAAVLVLWCLRKAFFPMLWLGLTVATISGRSEEIADAGGVGDWASSFDSAGDVVAALLSPLAIVLFAIVSRFVVAVLALVLAYPLTMWSEPTDYAHGRKSRSRSRLWSDRWYLTQAYRALRWTWAIRQVAADKLGEPGRQLSRCGPVLSRAGIGLFIGYLAATCLAVSG